MPKHLIRLALVIILVSMACSLPIYADPVPSPSPKAVSQINVTAAPEAIATLTPFQPIGPTTVPSKTPTQIPLTPTPTATVDPEMAGIPNAPTPIRINQKLPAGTVNLLVMGNDFRPGGGYRTDVIMLVSINTGKGTVSVVSFPRDLYVTIPGWTTQRINTAFPHGGFALMADTMEYNFGVRPKYYIMTNFQGFVGIINSLGGINVNAGQRLSDSCDLPQSVRGYCTINPGVVSMDGATALWYVRSRHSSSDFDRTRRAQEVLYGIFSKLMSANAITRLPELYANYQRSVETNLGVQDIAPLLPIASKVIGDSSLVHRYAIGPGQVTNFITSEGAMVLLPNYDAINSIIAQAVFSQ